MGPGPDGVTHRCTQPIRCVQPTLFMQGLVDSLRMFPGPQVLTAWSRLTSVGEFLAGGDGSRLRPCRCRSPPPRGTNPIMAMGPAGGTVFPQSSPRERVMQLGGGVRCRTSHRKLTRSDRGEISLFGQISLFGHPLPQTGLEQQVPAVCIPPGFF